MSEKDRTVMFQMPSMLAGSLACVEGTVVGRSFELTAGTFVIGRLDTSDLNLSHEPGVSKTHAKIIAEGDRYVLVDCESRNGTIVNGSPVQRKALQDGDEIRVCGCVLRFTQRMATATGINVRNADPRGSHGAMDLSIDDAAPAHIDETDPGGDPVSLNVSAPLPSVAPPSTSSGSVNQAFVPTAFEMPTFQQSAEASAASAPAPSQGRTLLAWYAGGLVSALLFGGSASAVIVGRAPPSDAVLAAGAGADAGPSGEQVAPGDAASAAATDPKPGDAKPADGQPPADAAPADAKPADAQPTDGKPVDDKPADDASAQAADAKLAEAKAAEAAAAEKAAKERADADAEAAKAAEAQAAKERAAAAKIAAATSAEERPRRARREREASSADSTSEAAGTGKQFSATAESSRADALKSRGGKVKTVEAKDGDTVSKGQVLVTFEEGASEGEIMSLKDRIATLEAVDSDDARSDLKAARAKLDALMSGAKSPPVVAGMSGVLTGFNVSVGDVLRQNGTIGRISDGAVPRRVRVRVDRSVRPSRGQSVTLITSGGERTGTVSTVSGKTVTVDTGDTPATDVEAVRF